MFLLCRKLFMYTFWYELSMISVLYYWWSLCCTIDAFCAVLHGSNVLNSIVPKMIAAILYIVCSACTLPSHLIHCSGLLFFFWLLGTSLIFEFAEISKDGKIETVITPYLDLQPLSSNMSNATTSSSPSHPSLVPTFSFTETDLKARIEYLQKFNGTTNTRWTELHVNPYLI